MRSIGLLHILSRMQQVVGPRVPERGAFRKHLVFGVPPCCAQAAAGSLEVEDSPEAWLELAFSTEQCIVLAAQQHLATVA